LGFTTHRYQAEAEAKEAQEAKAEAKRELLNE